MNSVILRVITIGLLYLAFTLIFWSIGSQRNSDMLINVNTALLGVNMVVLLFILPMIFNERKHNEKTIADIKQLKEKKEPHAGHLELLKEHHSRLMGFYKVMNFLYLQTLMLVTTFAISIYITLFINNDRLIDAINSSHVIVEIVYLFQIIQLLGGFYYTKNLGKRYRLMQSDEDNLLRKPDEGIAVRLTDKQIKRAKKISEQEPKIKKKKQTQPTTSTSQ